MEIREYVASDLPAVRRIWREVGWVDEDEAEHVEGFLDGATAVVAVVDGDAEACGSVHRGTMRHTDVDLDAAVVTSITTSRIGRKQGLGRAVLERLVVDAASDGAALAVLGMFEQGYYDRSGFGTGAEMVFHRLDPSSLPADLPYRRPSRLGVDDAPAMVAALSARARGHGAVTLPWPSMFRADASWTENGFGLGYRDEHGTLTHFVWCAATGEHGPYRVRAWAWRSTTQLRELLGALRSLADQVRWLVVPEPWCLQLQVLTGFPGRQYLRTKGTPNEYRVVADAWWQARVLDVPTAVAALRTAGPLRLDVELTDPLTERGFDEVAGRWSITATPDGSTATRPAGTGDGASGDDGVIGLACSVNTFTRLLLGVRHPSAVLASDGIEVAPDVAAALDEAIGLPRPDVGIDF